VDRCRLRSRRLQATSTALRQGTRLQAGRSSRLVWTAREMEGHRARPLRLGMLVAMWLSGCGASERRRLRRASMSGARLPSGRYLGQVEEVGGFQRFSFCGFMRVACGRKRIAFVHHLSGFGVQSVVGLRSDRVPSEQVLPVRPEADLKAFWVYTVVGCS
jgi:hypothetical protein